MQWIFARKRWNALFEIFAQILESVYLNIHEIISIVMCSVCTFGLKVAWKN